VKYHINISCLQSFHDHKSKVYLETPVYWKSVRNLNKSVFYYICATQNTSLKSKSICV